MTPEQLKLIKAARVDDLILIGDAIGPRIGPDLITRHGYRLVLVHRMYDDGPEYGTITVMVKTINSLLPHDWVMYRRFGKEYWYKHNRGKHSISIEKLLDEHSYIVLRPSEEIMFQRLLHGVCPYDACQQGLVPVNDYVARVLRKFREPVRNRDTTRGNTICPIFIGAQIYREHEEQVARFVAGSPNFDSTQYQVHIHRVNDRRRELSYEPISDSILPTHLTVPQALPGIGLDLGSLALSDATPRNPDSEGHQSPRPAAASEASQAGPSQALIRFLSQHMSNIALRPVFQPGQAKPASIKPYSFYKKAAERVLDNDCQVCQEPFEDGGLVAELPCWHFFHLECFQKWLMRKCPLRGNADTSAQ